MNRREFLQQTGLVSSAMLMPNFLSALAHPAANSARRLIIIQLSGGNDGLNTVIPYQNDLYYQNRPKLAISKQNLLPVHTEFGLHSSLVDFAKFYEQGELAIINGVGYPNPNRSHFRSMDIWHTASDSNQHLQTGWVGRLLDHHCYNHEAMAVESSEALSLAMKGETCSGFALGPDGNLDQLTKNPLLNPLAGEQTFQNASNEFLYKTLTSTLQTADYIKEQITKKRLTDKFPFHDLGKQLKSIAHLIAAGLESRVYYASVSGFDTHINQDNAQTRLLRQVNDSVSALVASLKKHNEWDSSLIFVFSEFGRRIAQNGSNGTDHGHGNVNFVLGGNLKQAGQVNQLPDLLNTPTGDIKMQVDFRSIYATLLENWLGYDSDLVLGKRFDTMGFV